MNSASTARSRGARDFCTISARRWITSRKAGHPQLGADFLRKFSEPEAVLNAAHGHHGDVPATTPYTPLVMAADAISASRPGARRESIEKYIKRLRELEDLAAGFDGVRQAYAIQAGREVRVVVDAQRLDDRATTKLARDISKKIENDLSYPGEIRVTVLREIRSVEYARGVSGNNPRHVQQQREERASRGDRSEPREPRPESREGGPREGGQREPRNDQRNDQRGGGNQQQRGGNQQQQRRDPRQDNRQDNRQPRQEQSRQDQPREEPPMQEAPRVEAPVEQKPEPTAG